MDCSEWSCWFTGDSVVLSGVTNRSVILPRIHLFITSRLVPADEVLRHEKSLEIFQERRITFH